MPFLPHPSLSLSHGSILFRLQPLSFEKSVPTMAPVLPHLSLSLICSCSLARKLTFNLHQIILLASVSFCKSWWKSRSPILQPLFRYFYNFKVFLTRSKTYLMIDFYYNKDKIIVCIHHKDSLLIWSSYHTCKLYCCLLNIITRLENFQNQLLYYCRKKNHS